MVPRPRRSGIPALLMGAVSSLVAIGCGEPPRTGPGAGGTGAIDPEAPPAEAVVGAPRLRLSIRIEGNPAATEYGPDLLKIFASVASETAADVFPPAPPFLRIRVREEGGDELLAPANPLRPRPEGLFPVSLEAGETVEVGPMPLDWFDLDPRLFGTDQRYQFEAEYRPDPGVPAIRESTVAKPLDGRTLWMPDPKPPGDITQPGARGAVPLRLLDARGRPRRYLEWSPDVGYMLPPPTDPDPDPAQSGSPAP